MNRNKTFNDVLTLSDITIPLIITLKRKRLLSFRFKQGSLIVSAPFNTSLYDLKQTLITKESWIRKHYELSLNQIVPQGQIQLSGQRYILIERTGPAFEYGLSESTLTLTRPSRMRPETAMARFQSAYARQVLIPIFEEACQETGLRPKRLTIKPLRSSHGRCSSKQEITLALNLIAYDPAYIRYVCLHELAHLVHMDHSKDFYALVSRYCPNYKALIKMTRTGLREA